MNKVVLPLLLVFLTPFFSFSQNELADINKRIDKYEDTIRMQKNEIGRQREKIQYLANRPETDRNLLKNTIKNYHLALLKLKDREKALKEVLDQAAKLKAENLVLNQKIEGLESDLEKSLKKEDSLNAELSLTLKKHGKQKIEKEGLKEAQDEYYHIPPPPVEEATEWTWKGDPILNLFVGYKFSIRDNFFQGVILHTTFGLAITSDSNVVIGVGSGYDVFNADSGFSAIPLFVSTKYAFNGKFIEGHQVNPRAIFYALFDAGFYPVLIENEKNTFSIKRWFANLGWGAAIYSGNKNLSVNPEISLRLQTKITTINLRIGLGIYLGR
ncbi:MAG: hypothetical protein JWQ09_1678 [Segetibacter sp.]|nr:hypothetical protein [Segetibacter sp.]